MIGFYSCSFSTSLKVAVMRKREKEAFENIVEEGENAGNQHFLLFPKCFLHR